MISIKRFLESDVQASPAGMQTATLNAYRSTLTAIGISAVQACPPVSQTLPRALTAFGQELSAAREPDSLTAAASSVENELQQWGCRAQAYLEQKTDDVKELLVVLARTASTIGSSDERYTKRLDEFTSRLQSIANLEDLTQVRTSLVQSAVELRSCVEQMSQDSRRSVVQLQAEVATYQTKLEEVEQLASKDTLTGLFNRGRVEAHLDRLVIAGQVFSIAVIDLNGFKQVNDTFGHAAGDDLLKQFSAELKSNARAGDVVGRWGGDEFIVVLNCAVADAETHVDRIEKWVVGDYVVDSAAGPQKVQLRASIGLAGWEPGTSAHDVIAKADAAMYQHKGPSRR